MRTTIASWSVQPVGMIIRNNVSNDWCGNYVDCWMDRLKVDKAVEQVSISDGLMLDVHVPATCTISRATRLHLNEQRLTAIEEVNEDVGLSDTSGSLSG